MSKSIPIKELPLYKSEELSVFVEDPPLVLESSMGDVHRVLEPTFDYFGGSSSSLEKYGRTVSDKAKGKLIRDWRQRLECFCFRVAAIRGGRKPIGYSKSSGDHVGWHGWFPFGDEKR